METILAGFEDLIRGALQKSGNPSADRRAAIYASSRQALEKMLTQNQSIDENTAAIQRQRLEEAITSIEEDFKAGSVGAVQPEPSEKPAPAPPPPQPVAPPSPPSPAPAPAPAANNPPPAPSSVPSVDIPVASAAAPTVQPAVQPEQPARLEREENADSITLGDEGTRSDTGRLLQERRPYAKLLLWTIILVGFGVAIWWAITFGPAMIKEQLGGSVPNPSQTIESGGFVPENEEGWATLFNPAEDAANIDATGRGTADLFQDGNNNFVRIASTAGSSSNTLKIKVPRGVLLPLRGKEATFEVLLKNPSEKPHQFAIFCEFGSMGDCGRKRFMANNRVEAFIFVMLLEDKALAENEDAYVSIHSDLSGGGNPLDLFAIRVRTGE